MASRTPSGIVDKGPAVEDPPVIMAGAGIAGLTCAIILARAGRQVIVREWHNSVGHRFHGDFQGLENWSRSEDAIDWFAQTGIERNFSTHAVHEGVAFDAQATAYPIRSARPLYYLVRRGSEPGCLDHGLLQQALMAGVDVRFGDRVTDAGGQDVLAIGPRRADVIAAGYVFETDCPDGNYIALNNSLAPGGYAYLLIRQGRGTLASCMFSGFKQQAEYVARTAAFFAEATGLDMRNARPFGGFGNIRVARTAMQGKRPVIGEQAGFQDALAGFGMGYALRSGQLAAQSILTGATYRTLWRRDLRPMLRTGISNRCLYELANERLRRWALNRLSRTDAGRKLGSLYRPSLLTQLVYPVARWRLGKALNDPSCDHENCTCVWCQHGLG